MLIIIKFTEGLNVADLLIVQSVVIFMLSFVSTYLFTPMLINKLHIKGLVNLDLHRHIMTPNIGGISIFVGFSAGVTLAGLLNINSKALLMVFLIGVLAFIIGLLDDILSLSRKALVLSSLFIGLPFLTYRVGYTVIVLTPVGPIDLGLLFWPLAVLGVAFLSNSVNIYAGFNGLEAGLGLITSLSLALSAFLYGSIESALLLLILSASLLAFLKYNFYPARIFPGNSGTYLIGAVIASSIIVGTIKTAGLIACLPYIVNFIIRLYDRMRWTVGENTEDGRIYCKNLHALWCLFMYKKPATEKEIVLGCWTIQAIFGILAIIYSLIANVYI